MLTWNLPFSHSDPNPFISTFSQRCFLGNESSKFVTCCVICILFYLFWTLLFQVSKGLPTHLNICGEGAWQRHELALQTHLLVEVSQVGLATLSFLICEGSEPQLTDWFQDTVEYWVWAWFVKAEYYTTMHCAVSVNKLGPIVGQLFGPSSPEISSCAAKLAPLLVN